MRCEWPTLEAGTPCVHCGIPLPITSRRPPNRNCRQRCIHFGEPTRVESIDCKECSRPKVKEFPVHACAVFGECLPTYRQERMLNTAGEELPHKCHGCESRQTANQPIDNSDRNSGDKEREAD